jgi:hypothetical protein
MLFYSIGIYLHLVCSTKMVMNIEVIFERVRFWGEEIIGCPDFLGCGSVRGYCLFAKCYGMILNCTHA